MLLRQMQIPVTRIKKSYLRKIIRYAREQPFEQHPLHWHMKCSQMLNTLGKFAGMVSFNCLPIFVPCAFYDTSYRGRRIALTNL